LKENLSFKDLTTIGLEDTSGIGQQQSQSRDSDVQLLSRSQRDENRGRRKEVKLVKVGFPIVALTFGLWFNFSWELL